MQTIGERFEDMRKRKGVSLREAAEATKIRGDYLQKFESNQFDIGLGDIYVRGFLRSYAQFLKLPAERILNDFESLGHADARPRQPSREVYGRMDLSVSSAEERGERPATPAAEAPAAEKSAPPAHSPRHRGSILPGPSIDPALVFKGILVIAGVLLVLLLVFWAAKALFGGGSSEHVAVTPAPAAVAPAPEPMLAIIATEPVRIKVVRQSDGAELFQGQLEKDERREFPNAPILLTATALESVRLEYKGKQFMFQGKGYKRVPVDANQFPRAEPGAARRSAATSFASCLSQADRFAEYLAPDDGAAQVRDRRPSPASGGTPDRTRSGTARLGGPGRWPGPQRTPFAELGSGPPASAARPAPAFAPPPSRRHGDFAGSGAGRYGCARGNGGILGGAGGRAAGLGADKGGRPASERRSAIFRWTSSRTRRVRSRPRPRPADPPRAVRADPGPRPWTGG